jgi:hypothetical protein
LAFALTLALPLTFALTLAFAFTLAFALALTLTLPLTLGALFTAFLTGILAEHVIKRFFGTEGLVGSHGKLVCGLTGQAEWRF